MSPLPPTQIGRSAAGYYSGGVSRGGMSSRQFADMTHVVGGEYVLDVPRHFLYHAEGIRDGLHYGGALVTRRARKLVRDPPKTGRIYIIRGQRHRASAPGEAPASREHIKHPLTGRLAPSIAYKVRTAAPRSAHMSTSFNAEMEFGDQVFYGVFLELGTRKMQARPHLRTAAEIEAENVRDAIPRNVMRRINRGR